MVLLTKNIYLVPFSLFSNGSCKKTEEVYLLGLYTNVYGDGKFDSNSDFASKIIGSVNHNQLNEVYYIVIL